MMDIITNTFAVIGFLSVIASVIVAVLAYRAKVDI